MKKVLLLGSSGQLGHDIIKYTSSNNIEITPLTRKEFDADKHDLFKALHRYDDHDYIINCIAYHKVDQCEDNFADCFRINGELVRQLAMFSEKNNITFIHISTDYVFDGYKRDSYTETDTPSPINVYGASKLTGEILTGAYCGKYFILRISALFGQKFISPDRLNFVEKMISASRQKHPLKVIDNQIMSPTHTKDVALAIQTMIEINCKKYGIYHACNTGQCSWFDFAKKIFDICGINTDLAPISYDKFHMHAKRPQYCSMSNKKLEPIFKMPQWETALKEYLELKGYI